MVEFTSVCFCLSVFVFLFNFFFHFFFFPLYLSFSQFLRVPFFLLTSSSFFLYLPRSLFLHLLLFFSSSSSSFFSVVLSFSLVRSSWFLYFDLPNNRCDVGRWLAMKQCEIGSVYRQWVSFLVVCSVWCGFPSRSEAHLGLNVNPLPPHFLISLSILGLNLKPILGVLYLF